MKLSCSDEIVAGKTSASKERLFACALANTPACVRLIRIREDLTGCAYPNPKSSQHGTLEAPRPVTRRALQVFLHEAAHYALDHRSNRPRYLEEYEAEVWSFARMREAGIPVPRKSLETARRDVLGAIQTTLARGMKRIDPKAARFARFNRRPPPHFISTGPNTFIWSEKALGGG
jgi:hypothetical protein